MATTPPALPWWQHLEDLRIRNDWNRTQLAERAGVARTTIDKWKTARRAPLNTTVTEVADRLGIDREEALRLAGVLPRPSAGQDPADESSTADYLDRLYRKVRDDPDRREELQALLESSEGGRDSPDGGPVEELERLWRRYRDDPGIEGETLRTLLTTWGKRDAG